MGLIRGDTILKIVLAAAALFVIGLLVAITVELFSGASPAILAYGPGFLIGSKWEPSVEVFGALPFI